MVRLVEMTCDKEWSDVPSEPVMNLKKGQRVMLHSHVDAVNAGYASYVADDPKPKPPEPVEPLPPIKDKKRAEKK